jgi:5-(carboxyamino)imidazole ribonucleotide synthase
VSVVPGSWLGLLGGGQLGRMFVHAAQRLGYKVLVLDPDPDCPAGQCADDVLVAAYDDRNALGQLARRCRAATTEFENVPAASLAELARHVDVSPHSEAVAVAQHRAAEKRLFESCGVPAAPHVVIANAADLEHPDVSALLPGILKTCTLGYDGQGQRGVATRCELAAAWRELGVPCVLERRLPIAKELSVIVARARDGATAVFPVAENSHRSGILALTMLPARVDAALAERARAAALSIAHKADYVGVLCVEFFVLGDGTLIANEMAPRPHNSGHATIEACVTSQFEQQVRITAGLPLGDPALRAPAVMLNLLGDVWCGGRAPDWDGVLAVPGASLHLYGKGPPRRGRKMGHVTCIGGTLDEALERGKRVAAAMRIGPAFDRSAA